MPMPAVVEDRLCPPLDQSMVHDRSPARIRVSKLGHSCISGAHNCISEILLDDRRTSSCLLLIARQSIPPPPGLYALRPPYHTVRARTSCALNQAATDYYHSGLLENHSWLAQNITPPHYPTIYPLHPRFTFSGQGHVMPP